MTISVASLFAERDERRRREQLAQEQLDKRKQEELAAFKERLDNFELTDDLVQAVLTRIRRAFDRGETELMITSFPSSFCTDDGRAVNNADREAPVRAGQEPPWLSTLPKGAKPVYDYWKANLAPGGFGFNARIINYPDGKPGDVGLFFSWPRSAMEA